jgi:hypothetical protein
MSRTSARAARGVDAYIIKPIGATRRAPHHGDRWPARSHGLLAVLACVLLLAPVAAAAAGGISRARPVAHAHAYAGKHHKHKRAGCRRGYVRERRVVHRMRHHHRVTQRISVCVKAKSGRGGAGSGSDGSGSGGSGSGSGSGGSSASGPPSATASSFSLAADGSLSIGAPGVLSGAHGSGLTAKLVATASHGTLTLLHDGSFTYAPSSGFVGTDSFSFKAVDSSFNSSGVETVTIAVTPLVNDASYSATSGTPLSVPAPGLLAGAVGGGLSAATVSGVSHGSLTLGTDGSFTYTSSPGYTGSDSFTYRATDADGASSNTATVTINVGQPGPPSVTPQSFSGAVANTELQVGGTRGNGAEVFLSGQSALAGDSDPGGGTLTATAGAITTAHGGTVTMAANGTFTYAPPVGYDGPSDSFTYQVDSTDGQSSQASATISFASGRVWYVDSSAGAGGNGTSGAPFRTLAQAVAVAGSGDVIFLAGGGPSYAGGVTLGAGETLDGESAGLTVGSDTLLAPTGTAPVIAGSGLTIGAGDTLAGLTITTSTGDAIAASGIDAFTLASTVSVSDSSGDAVHISGGSGTIEIGGSISGSGTHSVEIDGRTGGTVALAGTVDDTGGGILLANNTGATIDFTGTITANTGASPAFTATGGGTINASGSGSTLQTTTGEALDVTSTTIGTSGLLFQSIAAGGLGSGPAEAVTLDNTGSTGALTVTGAGTTAGSGGVIDSTSGSAALSFTDSGPVSLANMNVSQSTGDGVYGNDVAGLTLTGLQISSSGTSAILLSDDGTVTSTFEFQKDVLTDSTAAAISVALAGNASGLINTVTIGTSGTSGSGSSGGDGIDITNTAGTVAAEVETSHIYSVAGSGVVARANGGELDLTMDGNDVQMQSASGDATSYTSASNTSTFCLHTSGNTETAAGAGANATTVDQGSASSTFEIEGLSGVNLNPSTLLENVDTLTAGTGGSAVNTVVATGNSGFGPGTCTTPTGGGGSGT